MAAAKKALDEFEAKLAEIGKKGQLRKNIARLKTLDKLPDDPRLTETLIGWLYEARWPGSGAQDGWTAVFERLRKLNDARAIEPLRKLPDAKPPFLGKKHTDWVFEHAKLTAVALQKTAKKSKYANLPPIAIKAKKGATADTLSIIQRVFDSPDEDDLRRVVADELLEHDDPWGEFIQLGFLIHAGKATKEQKLRADVIVKKNSATLIGPIAKIAKLESRGFEKGFLSWVRVDATMRPRADYEAAANSPYWATVERLEFNMLSVPKWFLKTMGASTLAKRLKTVSFNRYRHPVITIERKSVTAPWTVLAMREVSSIYADGFTDWLAARPAEERKTMGVTEGIRHYDAAHDAIAGTNRA
jgi:hypothetical protein